MTLSFPQQFLRLRIQIVPKAIPNNSETHDPLVFFLHYAQRCYLLFSKKDSWYIMAGTIWTLAPYGQRGCLLASIRDGKDIYTYVDNKQAFLHNAISETGVETDCYGSY
jgi:hypothetical protein